MDDYGCCEIQDAELIAKTLRAKYTVTFSYSESKIRALIITISAIPHSSVLGTICYGGDPHGKYMVSVLLKGAFHFDLRPKSMFVSSYVGEKLNLTPPDAKEIADLLNAVGSFM